MHQFRWWGPFSTPTAVNSIKKYADFDSVTDVGHYSVLEKPIKFNQELGDVFKQFAKK